jgi:protein-L-isoaspartate(D-aspartate) O-methyltransferase
MSIDHLTATIRAAGIRDPRVLDAFRTIPREGFLPPEWVARAYEDVPLPIPHRQVTTQPSLIARMIEALDLRGDERVLEVGTGYGFQTALLCSLAREVWSVERFADVAQAARENLCAYGIDNAYVVIEDGSRGLPARGPYEGIVVAAAFPQVPQPLADQLAPGGRLVQPIGQGGREDVTLFVKADGQLVARQILTGAHFVRLVGEHGFEAA